MFLGRVSLTIFVSFLSILSLAQDNVFTSLDLFRMQQVVEAAISPDGEHVAYTVNIEKPLDEGKGNDYRELRVMNIESGDSRSFISGKNYLYSLSWSPDGNNIMFLAKMGDVKKTQVFQIPIDGGAPTPITHADRSISSYQVSPDGKSIAFVATVSENERDKKWKKMGFDAEIFEEEVKHRTLFIYNLESGKTKSLTSKISVFSFKWSPDGTRLALQVTDHNYVDDSYMFKRIHVVDPETGALTPWIDNPGKITSMAWSPDSRHLAFVSAVDINDPVAGSLFIANMDKPSVFSKLHNYSEGFEGSVKTVSWLDNETALIVSDESVDVTLRSVEIGADDSKVLIEGGKIDFNTISMANGMAAMAANSQQHPSELYTFNFKKNDLKRATNHNPWIDDLKFGKQEKVSYKARDGLRVDGVLVYPVDYQEGKKYPLVTYIHGGPEACVSNGWSTYYSMWGQAAAAKGLFVFMPNYRASSGRGVAYSKMDQGDLADEEFNDVIDGIDYLIGKGMVDRDKVGIGGGSYGGYFSAWAATKHSDRFAASVVFVGISNQISKRNTTDIPYEDYYVHWRLWTHENPELIYDRSPVKYVKNNKTPTLILHGKSDPRVHPSQSLELYRQLKQHGNAPVRLIWYPGEGHGNRNNPARLDYSMRTLEWFSYYLNSNEDKKAMPPKELEYQIDQPK